MRYILLICSILFTIDSIVLTFRRSLTLGLAIMYILSIIFIVLYFYFDFFTQISKTGLLFYLKVCIIVCTFIFICIASYIIYKSINTAEYDEDAIIVLGCGVEENDTPTKTAIYRLNAAIEYYKQNPNAMIVVTGSYSRKSKFTEAYIMKEYLVDNNIPESKILLEEKATSTMENFVFSKKLLQDNGFATDNIVFVTNNFHAYRSMFFAKQADFENITIISTFTDIFTFIPALIRECCAVIIQVFLNLPIYV